MALLFHAIGPERRKRKTSRDVVSVFEHSGRCPANLDLETKTGAEKKPIQSFDSPYAQHHLYGLRGRWRSRSFGVCLRMTRFLKPTRPQEDQRRRCSCS